jgi:hypothetical protein
MQPCKKVEVPEEDEHEVEEENVSINRKVQRKKKRNLPEPPPVR